MTKPEDISRTPVQELVVAEATGVWAVRSESPTVYNLDCNLGRVLRARGEGSGRGATDNEWAPLLSVHRLPDRTEGVITVGARHRWLLDPGGWSSETQWWVQRTVEAIGPVPEAEVLGR